MNSTATKMNSTATHNYLIVEIDSHIQVHQPTMTGKGDIL